MKFSIVGLLVLVVAQIVTSEKILVLSFFSSKSHKLTYFRLLEGLAAKGHEITILSPIKPFKVVSGIKEIYTFDIEQTVMWKSMNIFELKEQGKTLDPFKMVAGCVEVCNINYNLPHVKAILNEKFDIVFMQPMFNECALGIVYRLGIPLVLFYPTSVPSYIARAVGSYFPPSFVPNIILGFSDEMTFYQRFLNMGTNILFDIFSSLLYQPAHMNVYREKLGQDIPDINAIIGNASLILSNGHFSMAKPKPFLPDIVDVGGLHSRPARPLPKDLEDFIAKGGKNGFIYFSLGTAITGSKMPNSQREMILKVFSKLKQQVLWKWETEEMPDLPKNVKLSKWLPQQDLLGHKDIKMFITHCGGGSTEEGIYHGVPLIGIPMFGDQYSNANLGKVNGILVQVDWTALTEESLTNAINEILTNTKYNENAKRLSTVFRDQPDDPLTRGIYWVEYIIRHKGAPHLRSAARKLNFFQYHSYDVIAAYLTIIFTILYLIYAILKFVIRKLCKLLGFCSTDGKSTKKIKKQ